MNTQNENGTIDKRQCERCFKMFSTAKTKWDHVRYVHDKVKNFTCSTCNKCFKNGRDLKRHFESVHEKIKRFECRICNLP